MDAVDDFGDVFLLVEVDEFEAEELGELDFGEEAEEERDVVRVAVLEARVAEDAQGAEGASLRGCHGGGEACDGFGEGDAVAEGFFEDDDGG